MSTVVWNHDKVVLPINEPAEGRRKSQIEEYLDFYGAPGVQHIALAHARHRRRRCGRCAPAACGSWTCRPSTTTRPASGWTGIDLPWEALAELGILVDRDHEGYLLQIFTETLTDRPTVFFEIIQREGATGFGEGNFKALFESIERAQARRGNL